VLITYGDQVRREGISPLACLGEFLHAAGLEPLINTIHFLPFLPYSSDDGFSVIDYEVIDPALGDWTDVGRLGERFRLMFDLVINHVSRQSRWFADYVAGREPFTRYFIEADPADDTSMVTRPRSLPLLTPVETTRGPRHVWTTFSDDQIDLNFAEPDVLVAMLEVLLFYLKQGARIVRLDAIAYLWKELGTSCIHLRQTHVVVKLMRVLVDAVAPGTVLLTETNVPHEENVSYFGDGDEARMIYQFSLAPLLLDALTTGDASILAGWLADLEPPPPGCTVLNFTASHDGIGVRPMEGIVPPERRDRLVEWVRSRGGAVSTKDNPDGSRSVYELNVTYFDALGDARDPDDEMQVRRFLASQALMLSLRGIPGVYFHSLVGTPNDTAGVARTGRARSINRRKFELAELSGLLEHPDSPQSRVLRHYRRLLAIRMAQPAFHPDAPQDVIETGDPSLLGLVRGGGQGQPRILVLANVGREPKSIDPAARFGGSVGADLLGDGWSATSGTPLLLAPYQVAWLPA